MISCNSQAQKRRIVTTKASRKTPKAKSTLVLPLFPRRLSTVMPLLFPRRRLNHFQHVVLVISENPAEVWLWLVSQSLADGLLMLIGGVFDVPDLSH